MAIATRNGRSSTNSPRSEPADLGLFVRFCAELTLSSGKPFVLESFERRIMRDFFAGARETVVLLPKKNGKTTLMAALALYHLLVTPDAECVIGAAAREQATIMLRQIRGFIRRSEYLRDRLVMNKREIHSTWDEGLIRVMSSDADTGDGVIPTLAIVDELHRHKNGDLYGVFRDGLVARQGQLITISTAGDDQDSALGVARAKMYAQPVFEQDGAYHYARSEDGSYVMHEWALEPHEDRNNLEVVLRANPASWQTIDELRKRFESPMMTPWQWARFACGVWLQGEDRVIGPVEWAACAAEGGLKPPEGVTVRLGLDLGWSVDTTAAVPHWLVDGVAYLGRPRILVPPEQQGVSLRKADVIAALDELRAEYGAEIVVVDPENDGEVIAQDLEDVGFEVIAHSQKPQVMALAAERFYAAVREGKLRHPDDSQLNRHVLNAVRRSTEDGRWRFVKESKQSKKVIDGLIAAAMVHSVAVGWVSPEPLVARL
jgi:phage terminase large subunit-like protein